MAIHCVLGESVRIFDHGHYWEVHLHFHIDLWASSLTCRLLHPYQQGWKVPDSLLLSTNPFSSWMNCGKWAFEASRCICWAQKLETFSSGTLWCLCFSQPSTVASPMLYIPQIKSSARIASQPLGVCVHKLPVLFTMALWHAKCLCWVSYLWWFQSSSAASQSSLSHLVSTSSALLVARCSILHLVVLEKHFVQILGVNSCNVDGQSDSSS